MWNERSHVKVCETCNGDGVVAAYRRPTVDDPYPDDPCPDCDGPHEPECEVCGYNLEVEGYDCLVCETVAGLWKPKLKAFDVDAFAKAAKVALAKALEEADGVGV